LCRRMTHAARILRTSNKTRLSGKEKPAPRAVNFVNFRAAGAPKCS
jgi:hypothetical protein